MSRSRSRCQSTRTPGAEEDLIADEHLRKALLLGLYRDGTEPARIMADIIDFLTMRPDARRQVAQGSGSVVGPFSWLHS
jgi:hypothetical protein